MSDFEFPRKTDFFTRDTVSKGRPFVSVEAIDVAMPTRIDTSAIEVPVRPFDRSGSVFSTTSPLSANACESFELPQNKAGSACRANPLRDVYFPPWTFYAQSIDSFAPSESINFGTLHLRNVFAWGGTSDFLALSRDREDSAPWFL
jgi:hypothetical protein